MYFSNVFEDDEDYEIIECTQLDNNILLYKEKLDKNRHYVVKLKDKQYAVLFEKGQIFDEINETGIYTIKVGNKKEIPEDFKDYKIKNSQDNMCIIFFNMNTITNNKFYIRKKYKNNFYGDGNFEFKIEKPLKFFNKVIDIRSYYSREELLEQIRERISKIVISVIKNSDNEYIINKEDISSSVNIFEEYGIRIISSDIKNIKFKKKI